MTDLKLAPDRAESPDREDQRDSNCDDCRKCSSRLRCANKAFSCAGKLVSGRTCNDNAYV